MDINNVMDIVSVPAIVTVVYIIVEVLKAAFRNERFNDCIPLLCVVLGAVLGAVIWLCIPTMIPADNLVMAIVIGGMSGWAATGADQTLKKLTKGDGGDGTE